MIEKEVFYNLKFNENKLIEYGFIKEKDYYIYETVIMDSFKVVITIHDNELDGKLYDINFGDEYTIFRNVNASGYSLQVKDEYIKLLNDIKEKTIDKQAFIFDQTNRVLKYVNKKYNESCDYPWNDKTYSSAAVIRNKNNRKWYGLIMPITFDKLGEKKDSLIEVINLKLDDKKIPELIKKDGIYKAYHMNKKYWVTITLNDKISDEELFEYIDESRRFTEKG